MTAFFHSKHRLILPQQQETEKDLEKLQTGAELEFRVNGMDGKVFEAVLVSVDQMVDSANRSIKVYARVKKADAQFRPGMYVSAKVRANQ